MKKKTIQPILLGLLALASLASAIFLNTAAVGQPKAEAKSLFFEPKAEAEAEKEKAPAMPDVAAVQRILELAQRLVNRAN